MELSSCLLSSDENIKKKAIYRILFDRRADLLPELKKAIKIEKNEQIAVFMVQVCLTLSSFPRDSEVEKRILKILQNEDANKINSLTPSMWNYLENSANSKMIISILDYMGNTIPSNSFDFIEMCLTHPDPDVRTMVCDKAIKSGRPSHFAYVLNLITDKDPMVSETAFLAIKNLPESDLAIILDYSLGSPDEWVLNTIAPFLPKLINKNLRPIISKVLYHSNQNISVKAKEALKVLDSVGNSKNKKNTSKEILPTEPVKTISFKERLEQKRKEQEEIERKKKEEEEALDREIFNVDKSEFEDFVKTMSSYDTDSIEKSNTSNNNPFKEKEIIENTLFSEEANILSEIDDNALNLNLPEDTRITPKEGNKQSTSEVIITEDLKTNFTEDYNSEYNEKTENKSDNISIDNAEDFLNADTLSIENIDLSSTYEAEENNDKNSSTIEETIEDIDDIDDIKIDEIDLSTIDLEHAAETLNQSPKEDTFSNEEKKSNSSDKFDLTKPISINKPNIIINKISINNNSSIEEGKNIGQTTTTEVIEPQITSDQSSLSKHKVLNNKTINPNIKIEKEPKTITPIKVSVPNNIKNIVINYPSFIVDPLLDIYKANTNESKLKAINNVLTNITAFLNICFLQCSIFYAKESEMLTKSIKDCIKGKLIGPSSIRCLHNFVLALKPIRTNNVFFTFQLSKIMGSSIETNPLMLMRELKEYLREPEEPLDESVPQAIDGLIEILKGINPITSNKLVMRAPQGAKLPYADLSGPTAKPLENEKRPSIDLPIGEVVLISIDGGEALGLFPFFKYKNRKVIFTIPTDEELSIFYERLEITQ